MEIQQIKQRFGIIGDSPQLNRALHVATQVAPTDITVLITGESGTGKEIMPQVIHHLSARKHGAYIAVNCGAIPEGTIDSELFGHEKGSFTGASEARKGYFEVANGGTIFLDEVAELPLQTQVRLLRVLETGEFIRVGSSKVIKTDVRIIAATNVNIPEAVSRNKFREDLYYRLNTVPIHLPPLRDRKEDIHLLFRKFASDFADKYHMPAIRLNDDARNLLENYRWPGNIRQLRNITEQISVIEHERILTPQRLGLYLPQQTPGSNLPAVVAREASNSDMSEREILYKILFDMRQEITDLKSIVLELVNHRNDADDFAPSKTAALQRLFKPGEVSVVSDTAIASPTPLPFNISRKENLYADDLDDHEEVTETLSLEESEKELIQKALRKYNNRRKQAARELGISERTLYRKIKEYNLK